jgi:hypothetical protein
LELRFTRFNLSRGWFNLEIQPALHSADIYELLARNEIENKLLKFLISNELTRSLDYITLSDVLEFCALNAKV